MPVCEMSYRITFLTIALSFSLKVMEVDALRQLSSINLPMPGGWPHRCPQLALVGNLKGLRPRARQTHSLIPFNMWIVEVP